MKFFEYCFYRIHSWYVHKKVASTPRIYSTNWVSFGQIFNILMFIQIFCFIIDVKFEILYIMLPLYIIIYGMNYFVLLTEKKYEKLVEKYKEESYKKLKGWGVFLYLISSLVVWLVCAILLKNVYTNYDNFFNLFNRYLFN